MLLAPPHAVFTTQYVLSDSLKIFGGLWTQYLGVTLHTAMCGAGLPGEERPF